MLCRGLVPLLILALLALVLSIGGCVAPVAPAASPTPTPPRVVLETPVFPSSGIIPTPPRPPTPSPTPWVPPPAPPPARPGERIAFEFVAGTYDIYVMNADGTGRSRLTTDDFHDRHPAWSPDGMKIAFSSVADGDWEIFVMNADGGGRTRLTRRQGEDQKPAWSPDGSKIAFYSARLLYTDFEIKVMNADGSGMIPLTTFYGSRDGGTVQGDMAPSWSPDGTRIAFWSSRYPGGTWVMYADGTGLGYLVAGTYPCWAPLPGGATTPQTLSP